MNLYHIYYNSVAGTHADDEHGHPANYVAPAGILSSDNNEYRGPMTSNALGFDSPEGAEPWRYYAITGSSSFSDSEIVPLDQLLETVEEQGSIPGDRCFCGLLLTKRDGSPQGYEAEVSRFEYSRRERLRQLPWCRHLLGVFLIVVAVCPDDHPARSDVAALINQGYELTHGEHTHEERIPFNQVRSYVEATVSGFNLLADQA